MPFQITRYLKKIFEWILAFSVKEIMFDIFNCLKTLSRSLSLNIIEFNIWRENKINCGNIGKSIHLDDFTGVLGVTYFVLTWKIWLTLM